MSSDSPIAEGAGVLIGGQRHSARFTSSDDSPLLPLNNLLYAATNATSTSKKRIVNQNTKANLTTKTTTTNSNGKLNRSFTSLNLSASKRQHTNSTTTPSSSHITNHGHSRSKPAELYRTDFITAMKIPDTEVI